MEEKRSRSHSAERLCVRRVTGRKYRSLRSHSTPLSFVKGHPEQTKTNTTVDQLSDAQLVHGERRANRCAELLRDGTLFPLTVK